MPIAYNNCRVFDGDKFIEETAVLVKDNKIVDVVPSKQIPADYEQTDLKGLTISPAFIDLQIYGGNGKMFSHELSVESLQATYEYCLNGGCAYFMITMATNTIEKFLKGFEVVREYWQGGGKGLLGLHLEGPYMNPVKRGAHILSCIKSPTKDEIELLLAKGKDVFKMMTLAPEVCDPSLIQLLIKNKILVSAGHTNATYEQAVHGFSTGIPMATHLFNAMSALQHREPGMVGAIFNHPSVKCSLVCDGIHVDYEAIKIAKRQMGERLFYITDAVAETTTGEYQHLFKGDRYALPDGTLSGSALTMIQSVKNGKDKAGISLEESLRMATSYPASLIKEKKIGRIEKGYEASFVVFDNNLVVRETITSS